MGKSCKVVVCGQASVGKTSILEQLLYGNHVVGELLGPADWWKTLNEAVGFGHILNPTARKGISCCFHTLPIREGWRHSWLSEHWSNMY